MRTLKIKLTGNQEWDNNLINNYMEGNFIEPFFKKKKMIVENFCSIRQIEQFDNNLMRELKSGSKKVEKMQGKYYRRTIDEKNLKYIIAKQN